MMHTLRECPGQGIRRAGHGCDGLFALGSTGEMVLIDEDDRRTLIAALASLAGSPRDQGAWGGQQKPRA